MDRAYRDFLTARLAWVPLGLIQVLGLNRGVFDVIENR